MKPLTDADLRARMERRILRFGGVRAYSRALNINHSEVSRSVRTIPSRRIAEDIGVRSVLVWYDTKRNGVKKP